VRQTVVHFVKKRLITMNIESLLQDARFGCRTLLKARGFAVACVLTLALGIGCATMMLSLFEGPILNRPPVHDLDKIANIWLVNYKTGDNRGLISGPNFQALRNSATAFKELAALAGPEEVLTGKGQPRRVAALTVSSNFFHLLGVTPKLGRTFSKDDEQLGALPVAVISDAMWRSDFGGRSDALGQDIRLNDVPYRVVGVMPANFWFGDQGTEVWMPLTSRTDGPFVVVGRLRRGITDRQANAGIAVLSHALELQFPSATQGMGMRVVTYESEMSKKTGLGLVFVMGPSILVLLIGCANITNLLLARGFVRQTEFATRAALGATRGRMIRQLLSEYSLIAIAGAIAGVLRSNKSQAVAPGGA
jgi:predicted permease